MNLRHLRSFWTPRQLAKHLSIDIQAVYRLCRDRRIPFIRLARGKLRFDPRRIEEWADAGGVQAYIDGRTPSGQPKGSG